MIIFQAKFDMDRVFKSKVGWWYHLVLLVMVASTVFAFVGGQVSRDDGHAAVVYIGMHSHAVVDLV